MRSSSPFNTGALASGVGRVLGRGIGLYRHALRVGRWTAYATTVVVILFVALLVTTRVWLPTLAQNKVEIERILSERSGQIVRVDATEAYWDGLHPGLRLQGLRVHGETAAPAAVDLRELRVSLAWTPLLRGRFSAHRLTLVQPKLALERLADGRLQLRGLAGGDAMRAGATDQFVEWLFAQSEIRIEDGDFRWIDARDAASPMTLSHVDLSLLNDGQRHRLNFNAQFPPELCTDCSFIADVRGNPLKQASWRGHVYVRARDARVAGLPLILRERLPVGLKGTFQVQAWSDWDDGRLQKVNGTLRAGALQLPVSAYSDAIEIRRAAAEVDWTRRGAEGWRLELKAGELAMAERRWDLGNLQLQYHPRRSKLHLQNADLDDITALLARLQSANPWLATLRALDLKGQARNIDAEIEGPWSAPTDYALNADLINVAAEPLARLPGVRGLQGRVEMTRAGGRFLLAAHAMVLDFPRVFTAPIDVTSANGTVRWQRGDTHWTVVARDLKTQSLDGRANASVELRLPFDRTLSPQLRLRADVRGVDARRAPAYYPIQLSERARAWLAESITGGTLTQAQIIFDGPVRRFPFRDGGGRFEARGHVSNGVYAYLPGWAPLTQVEADLSFKGPEMAITGQGRLRGLTVRDVAVRVPDLGIREQRIAEVSANVVGPLAETVAVLRDRPSKKWSTLLSPALQASGEGVLGLHLVVFPHDPAASRITGQYRVTDGSMRLPFIGAGAPRVEGVQGEVAFTETGPVGGYLRGRVLGGETTLTLTPSTKDPRLAGRLAANGRVTAAALAAWAPAVAGLAEGETTWLAEVQLDRPGVTIDVNADLAELAVTLPAPLDKVRGVPLRLTLATEAGDAQRHVLGLRLGSRVSGRFEFGRDAQESWRFVRGHLRAGAGEPVLPAAPGVWLSVNAEQLNGDRWLRQLSGSRGKAARGAKTADARASLLPAALNRISLDVGSLTLFDRQFPRTSADLTRAGTNWSGTLLGSAIAGNVNVFRETARTRPLLHLELEHLRLPPKSPGPEARATTPADDADPRRLPAARVLAKVLEIDGRSLGALDMAGIPTPLGYKLQQFALKRPEMDLVVQGDWLGSGATQHTELSAKLNTTDISRTLAAFGVEDEMMRGRAELTARLGWDGGPAAMRVDALRGNVVIQAQDGAFMKVKQGAGKLLGLFNVRSLSRYASLDFRSVFGKGYVFDTISGELRLERGDAYANEIAVIGPSARLRLEGRVGVARRDLDLRLGVNPHLRDNLTVASGLIGGPIGAGTALVVQRLFKKQIAAGTRMVYTVRGSWDDPIVERVQRNGKPLP